MYKSYINSKAVVYSLVLTVFFVFPLQGQTVVPVQNYSPTSLPLNPQNWSIVQGANNKIYTASDNKLIEFDGVNWNEYPSANGSQIRSLLAAEELVYAGAYMDFGYWKENPQGQLEYTSIVENNSINLKADEQFWDVKSFYGSIIFRSLDRVYIYNPNTSSVDWIEASFDRGLLFLIDSNIVFQTDEGLFYIRDGKKQLYTNVSSEVGVILGLFDFEDQIFAINQSAEVFQLRANQWMSNRSLLSTIPSNALFNVNYDNDKGILNLGSVDEGLIRVDLNTKSVSNFNRSNGLQDNTVLNSFSDNQSGLWLALNYGVSRIDFGSKILEYQDSASQLGAVYKAIDFKNYRYLATNSGLYVKPLSGAQDYEFVEGSQGQVWNLQNINDELFMGHDKGGFVVKGKTIERITKVLGTWEFKPVPNDDSTMIQAHYDGLSVLRKVNGRWKFANAIEGFDISTRFLEWIAPNEIIINHEFQGLKRLVLDENYSRVTNIIDIGRLGYNTCIVKWNDEIKYITENAVYRYIPDTNRLFVDEDLQPILFEADNIRNSLVWVDEAQNLSYFDQRGLRLISNGLLENEIKYEAFSLTNTIVNNLNLKGFENASKLSDGTYLIGLNRGFAVLSEDNDLNQDQFRDLNYVQAIKHNLVDKDSLLNLSQTPEFIQDNATFSLVLAHKKYDKYANKDFRYRIVGKDSTQWMKLTSEELRIQNLATGNYRLQIQMVNQEDNTYSELGFDIVPSWIDTAGARILILAIVILLIAGSQFIYRWYYKRIQKDLLDKKQQQITALKNEKLNQEIKSKGKELANSTLSLVKKNELLNQIKDALKNVTTKTDVANVLRLIDANIEKEDDWELLKSAFNNVDKDFMKALHEKHDNLTHNDLRLCTYLRLNLSSKEIAQLLNISTKSVEVKRYRLRKKLDLAHEQSLTDYIMNLK